MTVSADPSVGSELLGYRIEELIGRGGMGVVFRARDQRLKRDVALKLLAPEVSSDHGFRERFLRESVLLASLDHPNVIPIYDAGEADGRLFIAMRYVEGGDLRDVLRAGPLEPELALEFCSQVAEALDASHDRGLVHRDVKPSNVLLDGRKHVYLADFGLTRHVAGDAPVMTAGSLGTIDYIAPEQIRGEAVDGRADLYSLGCLLYECLTGEPPFRRPSELAVAFAHLEEEPPSPPALGRLMQMALAKAPDDRFQSGHELVDATRTALGLDAPRRRRWPTLVATVVLSVVVAGLLSFLLTRGGSIATGRLLRIDPRSGQVMHTVDVGADPSAVASGDGYVWVSTLGDPGVWRIDPKTFKATRFAADHPVGVAIGDGIVYVPDGQGTVTELDSSGTRIGESPTNPYGGGRITGRGNEVWYVEEGSESGQALHLGPSGFGAKIRSSVRIPPPSPLDEEHVSFDYNGIALGSRDVWVAGDYLDRRVYRIDPRRKSVATIDLQFSPSGIAVGQRAVWTTDQLGDAVARIDPATKRVVERKVGRGPTGVAVGAGAVWVANTLDDSISRIDLRTGARTTIHLKVSPKTVAVADDAVWVGGDAG